MNLKDFSEYIIMTEVAKPIAEEYQSFIVVENNTWNGGICDCFNNMYPSMICSLATPYIYSSIMYQHITKKRIYYNPIFVYLFLNFIGISIISYSKAVSSIILYMSNFYILCVANFVRNYIRTKKNIPGSKCEDSFLTVFCLPCSLSQSARTLYSHDTVCDNLVCDSQAIDI
jgi:Cys-rich protein (TIGR01571 family)